MPIARKRSDPRALGLLAMLAAGLGLGAAVPASAETEQASSITVCSAAEAVPTDASEWTPPPTQTQSGKPF